MRRVSGLWYGCFFVLVGGCLSGCNTTATIVEGASDLLGTKARELRIAQARMSQALTSRREHAHTEGCENECQRKHARPGCVHHDGVLAETLQTEMNIILENGLELAGFQLDFDRIQELAKEQARYDEEYEKAMRAWHELEAEKYRRYIAQEAAKAQAHAAAEASPAGSCDCYALPSCAIPPPKEYVKSPPPKQRVVGLEEIPIVIRANARLNVGGMQYGKSQVHREFIPKERAKQPCCPKCGIPGCIDRCDGCGYVLPAQPHLPEPVQVPPAEAYRPMEDPGQAPLLHQMGNVRTGNEQASAVSPLRLTAMESHDRPIDGFANLQESRAGLPFQSTSSGVTWLNPIAE